MPNGWLEHSINTPPLVLSFITPAVIWSQDCFHSGAKGLMLNVLPLLSKLSDVVKRSLAESLRHKIVMNIDEREILYQVSFLVFMVQHICTYTIGYTYTRTHTDMRKHYGIFKNSLWLSILLVRRRSAFGRAWRRYGAYINTLASFPSWPEPRQAIMSNVWYFIKRKCLV